MHCNGLASWRKCCGLLSHSATLGCACCCKEFPGPVGRKDYSGFERDTWISRTIESHLSNVSKIRGARTKSEQQSLESKHGCRYSEFLRLKYFNPIRMLIIDPMHNLFLGTAKRVYKDIWVKQGIITAADMSLLQERVDSVCIPSTVGRIPRKIGSQFSSFTAEEWKNWIMIYSIICLRSLLPQEHLECWRHFVLACHYVCKRNILVRDIQVADAFLLHFCRRCQALYGRSCVTPNMHMHAHLRECLLDYEPVCGFWLFSFERYNGILGSQPTNNRCIEAQLLERFIENNYVRSSAVHMSDSFHDDFSDFFPQLIDDVSRADAAPINGLWIIGGLNDLVLPKKSLLASFTPSMVNELHSLLSKLYPDRSIQLISIPSIFLKYKSITDMSVAQS